MTEAQVGFLYNIAAAVTCSESDKSKTLLKSYYLMRCKDLTRGYGLPDKYFSPSIRCPNCCIEWKKDTDIKVSSINLSKRQKQRFKSREVKESSIEFVRCKTDLLHSNKVEQICTFCRKSRITFALKPQKRVLNPNNTQKKKKNENTILNDLQKPDTKKHNLESKKKEINVYANALDVFSLQNKNNALGTKKKLKVINNNKKKKDKFAGLCQQAVLASAKMKEQKDKQNKLNLFLKPSS